MSALKKMGIDSRTLVLGFCFLSIQTSSALLISIASEPAITGDLLPRFSTPEYRVEIQSDIAYLDAGRTEKCDLYLPENLPPDARVPAIVIIHGGGWMGGDKADAREIHLGTTLAKYGYVCMSINYLLCDGSSPSWPQNMYDCKSAVKYLRENAESLQIDTAWIGAIGGSAGGHLVSMLAVTDSSAGFEPPDGDPNISSRIQAVVDLYGIADVESWPSTYTDEVFGDTNLFPSVSPINYVTDDDPACLILHGLADQTVPYTQSIRFVETLASNSVPCRLVLISGAPHTFKLYDAEYSNFMLDIIDFFDEHLKSAMMRSPITQIVDDFNRYASTTELRNTTEPHRYANNDGTYAKYPELTLVSTNSYEGDHCLSVYEDTLPGAYSYFYGPTMYAGTNHWDFSGLNTFRVYMKRASTTNGAHSVTLYLMDDGDAPSWTFIKTISTVGGRSVTELPEWTAVDWDISALTDSQKDNISRILFKFRKEETGTLHMYMDKMGGL